MLITITLEFLSFLFLLIIFCSFIIRNKNKSDESIFFFRLTLVTLISILVEIGATFTLAYRDIVPTLNIIFNRVYISLIALIMLQISYFIIFLYNDEFKINEQKGIKLRKLLDILCIVVVLIDLFLPIKFISNEFGDKFGIYTDGPGVSFVIIYGFILFILDLISCLKFRNYFTKHRVTCLIFYFLLLFDGIIARLFLPGITIICCEVALIVILIYFLIENYDTKKVEQLKEIRDQANKFDQEKTKFLSNMSHEIRTSLNTIVVTSNDLLESNVDNSIKEELKDCLYASDTLLELVGNILDLNKISSEFISLNNVQYDLKKEVESIAEMTSIRIENKPINFIMNIDNSIPNILYGDKVYMKQIMNNLLTNAFKYTNEGEVKFNISCENDLTNKKCHLIISVQDTGIGIKDTSKIFDKFERLDVDKISTVEGTGLGLVITKKIIDSMNGTINVESTYGKGSKFTVELDQEIVDKPVNVVNKSQVINYNFGNRRILLLDDDKLNLKVEKKTLSKFNFKIDTANNADEALELIKNNGYDLIFTDAYLENGYDDQVLRYAKKFNIPVICLTADAIEGAEEKYLNLGYSYYISKPYTIRDIYDVLEKAFRK